MKTITIHHRKGGTGKTTTTQHLGMLSSKDRKTLLIDADGQGNLTTSFGVEYKTGLGELLRSVMKGDNFNINNYIKNISNNLDIIPANNMLFDVQNEIINYQGIRGELLKDAIKSLINYEYEMIFIDTPPSAGWLVYNALIAADMILTPVACNAFGVDGLSGLSETLNELGRMNKIKLSISAFVPTYIDARKKEEIEYMEGLREAYGSLVTNTIIRTDAKLSRSQTDYKTVFDMFPNSNAAKDYESLYKELFS